MRKLLIQKSDYVKANKLFTKLTRRKLYFNIAGASFLVFLALLSKDNAVKLISMFSILGGFIGHTLVRHVYNPIMTVRAYNSIRKRDEVELELVDDGINYTSATGHNKLTWDRIYSWRESSELIIILFSINMYYIVPKRLAESGFDIDKLKTLLTKNVGNAI